METLNDFCDSLVQRGFTLVMQVASVADMEKFLTSGGSLYNRAASVNLATRQRVQELISKETDRNTLNQWADLAKKYQLFDLNEIVTNRLFSLFPPPEAAANQTPLQQQTVSKQPVPVAAASTQSKPSANVFASNPWLLPTLSVIGALLIVAIIILIVYAVRKRRAQKKETEVETEKEQIVQKENEIETTSPT